MRVLLDTHVFLWWITDAPRISGRARDVIVDHENELFLSAASGWEIAIKTRLGKVRFPGDPADFLSEQLRLNGIEALPVRMIHALRAGSLPDHHRDPFDRLLVAQCQEEQLPILTADPQIAKYNVEVIW